jgi:hypothetical protein
MRKRVFAFILVLTVLIAMTTIASAHNSQDDEDVSQGINIGYGVSERFNYSMGIVEPGFSIGKSYSVGSSTGDSYSVGFGVTDGESFSFSIATGEGFIYGVGVSDGESFSFDITSNESNGLRNVQESEQMSAEFEQLWRNLEHEEQSRVNEWEDIMAGFAAVSTMDFDEAVFSEMSKALEAASDEFEAKFDVTMMMIQATLVSFWEKYGEMGQSIDSFFDKFWAENYEAQKKLDRFFDTFQMQNILIQGNLYVMQQYVDNRVATMGVGSGYGVGVREYIAPAQEERSVTEIDAETANYIIVHLVLAVVLGVLIFMVISRRTKGGRFHQ